MAEETLSAKWRREGNQHYVSAAPTLSPTVQKARLQKALTCYETAHYTAKTDDELSSAAKNIAMTSWKMAKISKDSGENLRYLNVMFVIFIEYDYLELFVVMLDFDCE